MCGKRGQKAVCPACSLLVDLIAFCMPVKPAKQGLHVFAQDLKVRVKVSQGYKPEGAKIESWVGQGAEGIV